MRVGCAVVDSARLNRATVNDSDAERERALKDDPMRSDPPK